MEPFDDPVLGHLVWNARFNEWQGEFITPEGVRVEFSVDCHRDAVPVAVREAFAWLAANEHAVRLQLAEQMVESANDWRQPGEAEIPPASFAGRVAPQRRVIW